MITEKKATKHSKPAKAKDAKKPANKTLKNKKSHKLGKGKPAIKKKKSMYEDKLPSAELHGKKGKLIQDKKLKESFDSLYENFMNSTENLVQEGWFDRYQPKNKINPQTNQTTNSQADKVNNPQQKSKIQKAKNLVPVNEYLDLMNETQNLLRGLPQNTKQVIFALRRLIMNLNHFVVDYDLDQYKETFDVQLSKLNQYYEMCKKTPNTAEKYSSEIYKTIDSMYNIISVMYPKG
jgi:hypothetical protein